MPNRVVRPFTCRNFESAAIECRCSDFHVCDFRPNVFTNNPFASVACASRKRMVFCTSSEKSSSQPFVAVRRRADGATLFWRTESFDSRTSLGQAMSPLDRLVSQLFRSPGSASAGTRQFLGARQAPLRAPRTGSSRRISISFGNRRTAPAAAVADQPSPEPSRASGCCSIRHSSKASTLPRQFPQAWQPGTPVSPNQASPRSAPRQRPNTPIAWVIRCSPSDFATTRVGRATLHSVPTTLAACVSHFRIGVSNFSAAIRLLILSSPTNRSR